MRLITVKSGDYSAVINLDRGANCVSLRHSGYGARLLREPDYEAGELDNPYLYGMPILFPVNRISGGEYEFEGRSYRFPINEPATGCHLHGELHKTPFELIGQSEDRIVCRYRSANYLSFPHDFEIRMEYSLSESGLTHTVEVTNHSGENMPCMIGFHTTFNSAFAGSKDVKVQVAIEREYERNMKNYLPTGRTPEPDGVTRELSSGEFCPFGQAVSRHYRAKRGGLMTLTDEARGLQAVYENDEKYGFRLIYNGAGDEYICLEPQNCAANAPNAPFGREEGGFDFIAPHSTKKYTSKIYIKEFKK